MLRPVWLLLALVGACAAEPADFQVIKGRVRLPKTARPPTMRVVLNDGAAGEEHATFTRVDGSFEVRLFALECLPVWWHRHGIVIGDAAFIMG